VLDTFAAGTIAVSCVEETYVVESPDPFQSTVELVMKLVPFTVSVNVLVPAVVEVGEIDESVGEGFGAAVIVNVTAPEVPPIGNGLKTVTVAVPVLETFAAGTLAVRDVPETYVVVSAVPFHLTLELALKLVPVTVSVKVLVPADVEVERSWRVLVRDCWRRTWHCPMCLRLGRGS